MTIALSKALMSELNVMQPKLDEDEEEQTVSTDGPLELTLENVEKVLDEMRPYLMSDGGNVRVSACMCVCAE
jgi:hypothetical protein